MIKLDYFKTNQRYLNLERVKVTLRQGGWNLLEESTDKKFPILRK
jgi:hypothetical protein